MKIYTKSISFSTKGNCDIIKITAALEGVLKESGVKDGVVSVFIPGATGAITTTECETGLIEDIKKMFRRIIPEKGDYLHDANHPQGNAPSHLRASLVGPSITIPVTDGVMTLGRWQEVIFIDFDNRPRQRNLVVKIIGE